jgi:hypothetical protein
MVTRLMPKAFERKIVTAMSSTLHVVTGMIKPIGGPWFRALPTINSWKNSHDPVDRNRLRRHVNSPPAKSSISLQALAAS